MAIRYTVGNLAEATKVTTDVTEPPNPRADDSEHVHRIRILVIGASGVGKSALIATVSGQSLAVDHDLTSEMPECSSSHYHSASGHIVDLIDTPGFNNTDRSDKDVLLSIINTLKADNDPIAGVIYMHRITDKRFTGADRTTLNIFQALCGEQFAPHIVLCSTMWNTLPSQAAAADAVEREHELCSSPKFWAPLIDKGARYMHFEGDSESGRAIVEHIICHPAERPMGLQLELHCVNCTFEDTAAGQLIEAEARRREDRLRQEWEEEQEERCKLNIKLQSQRQEVRVYEEQNRHRVRSAGTATRNNYSASQHTRAENTIDWVALGAVYLTDFMDYINELGKNHRRRRGLDET